VRQRRRPGGREGLQQQLLLGGGDLPVFRDPDRLRRRRLLRLTMEIPEPE
jgi:hypothetical protein